MSRSLCQVEATQTLEAIYTAQSTLLHELTRSTERAPVDATGQLFSLLCKMLQKSRFSDTNWNYTQNPIEYNPTHSFLAKYAIDLCNSTLNGNDEEGINVFSSSSNYACPEAEKKFLGCAQDKNSIQTIYINDDGDPALFQKTYGWGERTGLSLKPVVLGGNIYAAGTIFAVNESFSSPFHRESGLTIRRLDNENINSMSAIRPAIFSLSPEERFSAAKQLQVDHIGNVEDPEAIQISRETDFHKLTQKVSERSQLLVS